MPYSPKNSVIVLVSIPPPSKSSRFLLPVVIFCMFIRSSFTSRAVLNLISSAFLAARTILLAVVRGIPAAWLISSGLDIAMDSIVGKPASISLLAIEVVTPGRSAIDLGLFLAIPIPSIILVFIKGSYNLYCSNSTLINTIACIVWLEVL